MNGIMNSFKRLFSNKNTVTIIGVLLVLVLLYWGYSSQVKNAVRPVEVPVASRKISPRTQINAEMIVPKEISEIAIEDNVYRNANAVIGLYSDVNTVIPAGSMFFKDVLVEKDQLPDSAFFELGEDEIPYLFSVNVESTFGNSIFPGNKIDIYMKALDDNGRIMVGKLLADVTVRAVKTSNGENVFENMEEVREPSYLLFGLSDELHILMRKADYLETNSIELFPVPHGGTIPSDGEIRVTTEYLRDFIVSKTVVLEGQEGSTNNIEKKGD